MIRGFCVYFVYMIPLETDVLRKHRFQIRNEYGSTTVLYQISQPRRFSLVFPDRAILFALPVLDYNG